MIRRATLISLVIAACMLAQEPARSGEVEQQDPWLWWKWANFAILAVGIGYMIAKNAPRLYAQRSQEIQGAIEDAAKQKKDAEAQAAAIEQRLAGLQAEIDDVRREARARMAADHDRISRDTELRLKRIHDQAAQEITLMTRGAREELRKYSAQLAIELAQQRIRTRITAEAQNGLVDAFLHDLHHRPATGARA